MQFLSTAIEVIFISAMAVFCLFMFFRTEEIEKHNAKLSREKGWNLLARAHERKESATGGKIAGFLGFFLCCYALYQTIFG